MKESVRKAELNCNHNFVINNFNNYYFLFQIKFFVFQLCKIDHFMSLL